MPTRRRKTIGWAKTFKAMENISKVAQELLDRAEGLADFKNENPQFWVSALLLSASAVEHRNRPFLITLGSRLPYGHSVDLQEMREKLVELGSETIMALAAIDREISNQNK